MEQKAFILQNKGMNRDLSVSKTGESSAYENHNIRITARDHDTLLSITNERGTKEIELASIDGEILGWSTLNNHIILFTHKEDDAQYTDRIYRIDYTEDGFKMVRGSYTGSAPGSLDEGNSYELDVPLFSGDLGFYYLF